VTARRLTIAWGLHCVLTEDPKSVSDMVTKACRLAAREGMAEQDDKIIVSAGLPFGTPGATNMLRIVRIDAQAVRIALNKPEITGPSFN
jgi:pyruvate kinase